MIKRIFFLLSFLSLAALSYGNPTMVRVGYAECSTCHYASQGGGLLTTYGKGIDDAQSLLTKGIPPADVNERKLLWDTRVVFAAQQTTTPDGSGAAFQPQLRTSYRLTPNQRLYFTATAILSNRDSVSIPKATYEYRPMKGVAITAGRDELPTGIGLPDPQAYIRRSTDLGVTFYPTQLKAFLWNDHFQLTPFVFGPGGGEEPRLKQSGMGGLAGLDLFQHHTVVGVSALSSHSDAFERRSLGAYLRLGFGKLGVLAEHELTGRTPSAAPLLPTQFISGSTTLFFYPKEWLSTSLIADETNTSDSTKGNFRFAPSISIRVNPAWTAGFTYRDTFTTPHIRTYSLSITYKNDWTSKPSQPAER